MKERTMAIKDSRTLHLDKMRESWSWTYGILPLINKTRTSDPLGLAGALLDNGKPCVYLVNIFNLPKDMETAKKEEFNSYEEIYDAGWRVD